MTDTATNPQVRAADFTDFAEWYSARYRRSKGRLPAPATVQGKYAKLAALCATASQLRGTSASGPFDECLRGILYQQDALEDLTDRLLASQASGTVRGAIFALADYGDFLVARGEMTNHVVSRKNAPPDSPPPPIVTYTDAEMRLLVDSARGVNLRWWALMAMLADTGRRIGELLSLEWAWFRLEANPPHVQLPRTKNGDQAYIPLTKRLREDVFVHEVMASFAPKSPRRTAGSSMTRSRTRSRGRTRAS